jgi:hypothetical protein
VPEAAGPEALAERVGQARVLAPVRQVAELPGARVQALAGVQAEPPPAPPEVPPPAEVLLPDTLVRVQTAARPRTRT